MIPSHYISLELLRNDYFILVSYKFYSIPYSSKITRLIFCALKMFHYDGVFLLIVVY